MSKHESSNDFLHVAADRAAKFIAMVITKAKELFEKFKKSDRRFIILVSVAAILVIILFALIINGIVKSDNDDEPIESEPTSMNIIDEPTTETPVTEPVATTMGTYTVTLSDPSWTLKLRQRADENSSRLGEFANGTTLEVLKIVQGTNYRWGLVISNDGIPGWVCMDYLKK